MRLSTNPCEEKSWFCLLVTHRYMHTVVPRKQYSETRHTNRPAIEYAYAGLDYPQASHPTNISTHPPTALARYMKHYIVGEQKFVMQ